MLVPAARPGKAYGRPGSCLAGLPGGAPHRGTGARGPKACKPLPPGQRVCGQPVRRPKEAVGAGPDLMADPKMVLLDEPGAGVNRTLLRGLSENILRASVERDVTFVIIEHDMKFIMAMCDPIIVMAKRRGHSPGDPNACATGPRSAGSLPGRHGPWRCLRRPGSWRIRADGNPARGLHHRRPGRSRDHHRPQRLREVHLDEGHRGLGPGTHRKRYISRGRHIQPPAGADRTRRSLLCPPDQQRFPIPDNQGKPGDGRVPPRRCLRRAASKRCTSCSPT